MKFILGLKIGMSQFFDEKGNMVPVTLIEAGPCEVTQLKTKEQDDYEAIQVGFKKIEKEKKIKKSLKSKPFRFLREFKNKVEEFKLGQKIEASVFNGGDVVRVSGVSKGKGFSGTVKRWGFSGKNTTHGTKHEVRSPGSIGARTPSRVVMGKKMAGRGGGERITVDNLKVVKVDRENNLIALQGAVPGRNGTLLEIRG